MVIRLCKRTAAQVSVEVRDDLSVFDLKCNVQEDLTSGSTIDVSHLTLSLTIADYI